MSHNMYKNWKASNSYHRLGIEEVSSDNLVPRPPAKITTFIFLNFYKNYK